MTGVTRRWLTTRSSVAPWQLSSGKSEPGRSHGLPSHVLRDRRQRRPPADPCSHARAVPARGSQAKGPTAPPQANSALAGSRTRPRTPESCPSAGPTTRPSSAPTSLRSRAFRRLSARACGARPSAFDGFSSLISLPRLSAPASLGDRRWRELLEAHRRAVRRELSLFGGVEVDTVGWVLLPLRRAGSRDRLRAASHQERRRIELRFVPVCHTGSARSSERNRRHRCRRPVRGSPAFRTRRGPRLAHG